LEIGPRSGRKAIHELPAAVQVREMMIVLWNDLENCEIDMIWVDETTRQRVADDDQSFRRGGCRQRSAIFTTVEGNDPDPILQKQAVGRIRLNAGCIAFAQARVCENPDRT